MCACIYMVYMLRMTAESAEVLFARSQDSFASETAAHPRGGGSVAGAEIKKESLAGI